MNPYGTTRNICCYLCFLQAKFFLDTPYCNNDLFCLFTFKRKPMHTGSLWPDLFQNYRNIAFANIWYFLALAALKDTKKPIKVWKRPKKAVKVILKARESKNGNILVLLHFCDHLVSKMKRIQYFDVSRS